MKAPSVYVWKEQTNSHSARLCSECEFSQLKFFELKSSLSFVLGEEALL